MPGSRLTLRVAALAALLTGVLAIPASEIFRRQDTCFQNFKSCGISGLPGFFCCPNNQRCISLAGGTTVLCCPQGSTCRKIEPLPCDITLQDGQKNPDSVIKTTALKGTLPKCGAQCCPFGYSCENNECVVNANQNVAPVQSGVSSTARPSSTSTGTSGPTNTGTRTTAAPTGTRSADSDESTTSASPEPTGPPIAGIAGGAAAGAVILIVIAVLAFIFIRKRKAATTNSKSGSPLKLSRSTSSFGNIISGPIVQENSTLRTDFARVPPPAAAKNSFSDDNDPGSVTGAMLDDDSMFFSPGSSNNGGMMPRQPPAARMSSVAYGYGGPSPPPANYGPSPQVPSEYARMPAMPNNNDDDYYEDMLMPQTPRQGREPSSVSINVFADPNITPDRTPETGNDRRYTDMTTFTRMLDSADLSGVARGEPYVYGQSQGR
ncbi:hypothetical protein QBC44DRAFT_312813 [Cladorrhinum sp. PSN332]|nr:hypothetical protein QBC44DRAFT_312813 [Cladorrhinum sp. PSN332]